MRRINKDHYFYERNALGYGIVSGFSIWYELVQSAIKPCSEISLENPYYDETNVFSSRVVLK